MRAIIRVAVIAASLAGASAGIAVVALAHGGDATKIHACVVKDTKYARILAAPGVGSASDSCKSSETAVDWNAAGPQGSQGPAGPAGAQGPAGPQGPAGVSGWEIVTEEHLLQPNTERAVVVECPPGKKVLSGGYDAPYEIFDNEYLSVGLAGPRADGSGWFFAVDNDTQNEPGLLVNFRAICAAVP